ncbi:hypothetical protein [Caldimonas tepidiphila]|uniref:hypothetical protein n=1 Tax=Caldimonas tepidiphila TaxID=2315841 RepID=UPI000E5A7DB9|nr:hypothetical protein [Caldimonas tepidiphila]
MPTYAAPSLVELHTKERVHRSQTYAEIATTVEDLRTQLMERGIRCPPNSALGSLLLKASALNEQWEAQTHGQDILTLMQADEALRIAQAVGEVLDEPDAGELIRRMTKSDMNLSTRQPSQGKDALWELDLLKFLTSHQVAARLQEPPDIALDLPDGLGSYGIACKKLYSEDSLETPLRKGYQQLERMGRPGLIAFNLDDLTPQRSILVHRTAEHVGDFLHQRNVDFMRRHEAVLQRAVMQGRCDGVLFATTVQADIQEMSPRFNRFAEYMLWTVAQAPESTRRRLESLQGLIAGTK